MVYAHALGACPSRDGGSSPLLGTLGWNGELVEPSSPWHLVN